MKKRGYSSLGLEWLTCDVRHASPEVQANRAKSSIAFDAAFVVVAAAAVVAGPVSQFERECRWPGGLARFAGREQRPNRDASSRMIDVVSGQVMTAQRHHHHYQVLLRLAAVYPSSDSVYQSLAFQGLDSSSPESSIDVMFAAEALPAQQLVLPHPPRIY